MGTGHTTKWPAAPATAATPTTPADTANTETRTDPPHPEEDMRVTADSPRGWVHPDAAGEPAVEIFQPWPHEQREPAATDMPARWEVITQASRYLLDLHACTVTRRNLDVRELAPGAVHAQLRRDDEEMTLLAVPDCRVGRPMFLLLALERGGRIGTVRVTTDVRSITSITADPP